jgi:hypothetical protein
MPRGIIDTLHAVPWAADAELKKGDTCILEV